MKWHSLSATEAFDRLESAEHGLTAAEAANRVASHGRNELAEAKTDSVFALFLRQFQSPIIYILLAAAAVMFVMSHASDALIIFAVLFVNAVIGAVQEGRAQNTLVALKNMVRTNATVMRERRETIVPSEEIVPGDVIVLREGDKVPADARVFAAQSLQIDEAALTGESDPVAKSIDAIAREDVSPADQRNMVFKGTYVIGGEARAVVTDTGARTLIGGISEKLSSLDTDMPLKAEIQSLSRLVIFLVLGVCAALFVIGVLRGISFAEMFLTAVAVAVSAIPEGLPVVVTIVLAAGMYRMSRRNALVRKLQAVEALGQASVIAVDKTGTITMNQMMVERLYVDGKSYEVLGKGYEPTGEITESGNIVEPLNHETLLLAGRIASLTASATIAYADDLKQWQRTSGDPTEAALISLSQKIGYEKDALLREMPKVHEIPFSSAIKFHATSHESEGKVVFYIAGAPEVILEKATHVHRNGKSVPFGDAEREATAKALAGMSRLGLRIVALAAHLNAPRAVDATDLPDLCFVGLAGISDTVRTGVREALEAAHKAGVKVVMITGDYPETARAIGEKIGIYESGDDIITGKELSSLSEGELAARLPKTSIFARVTPEDKLKIIEAYRRQKIIIAMTGDGVNDALSLAAADLGVSMGKIGTEVAKEASDMVLLDDNFGSIVSAIEEGRNIYHTIKKVILYLLSTSLGEVLTITAAIVLGYPLPLLAGQIIWLNFITDGFLVVALALEPKEGNVLGRIKRHTTAMVNRAMVNRIGLMSVSMTAVSLALFVAYLDQGFVIASTVALTTLAVCQWYNAFNVRSEVRSVFNRHFFGNPFLFVALAVVAGLQVLAVYWTPLQDLLRTAPLALKDWYVILGWSLVVIATEEIRKLVARLRR